MNSPVQQKPERRRWRGALLIALIIFGGAVLGIGIYQATASNDADGRARDAAVQAYAEELASKTRGAITIRTTGNMPYSWTGDTHTLAVRELRLGTCLVHGFFYDVPTRPTSAAQLGELKFDVPGVNPRVSFAQASVESPNLYEQLMASGLKHCIAGDKRLMKPNFSG